jgi:hyperosmotically inducible protein
MRTKLDKTAATLAAALAASLMLGACQPNRDDAVTTNRGDSPTAMSDAARTTAGDAAITVAVSAALAKDSQLSAMRIDVDTDGGRVVLNGSAPSTAAKERATMLARGVDGVKSVDNRLAVAPTS